MRLGRAFCARISARTAAHAGIGHEARRGMPYAQDFATAIGLRSSIGSTQRAWRINVAKALLGYLLKVSIAQDVGDHRQFPIAREGETVLASIHAMRSRRRYRTA